MTTRTPITPESLPLPRDFASPHLPAGLLLPLWSGIIALRHKAEDQDAAGFHVSAQITRDDVSALCRFVETGRALE